MSKHVPNFKNEGQRLIAEKRRVQVQKEVTAFMLKVPVDTPENDPDVVLKDGVWVDVDHSDKGKG